MPPRQPKSDGAALVAAVCAAPGDDTPRLVYADWLEEHDRPDRAELIRVQVELARLDGHDPRRPDLDVRAAAVFLPQEDDLQRELPSWVRSRVDYRRGFADAVRVGLGAFVRNGGGLFRRAPVTAVELRNVGGELDLDLLAQCPHLAAVRDLHLLDLNPTALPVLLGSPHLAGLRGLHLESDFAYHPPRIDLAALAAAPGLPPLVRLGLNNRGLNPSDLARLLARPAMRSLSALSVQNTNLTPADVVAAVEPLAGLRELDLGQTWRSSDERFRVLFETPALSGLTRLGLGGMVHVSDATARALAACRYLRNLTDLDLGGTGVKSAGLEALVNSPNLPRLTRIDLFGTACDERRWEVWSGRAPVGHAARCLWVRRPG